jgi:ABC-type nitrate/sulfonate/bicarbonate transport system substrate-binding protein
MLSRRGSGISCERTLASAFPDDGRVTPLAIALGNYGLTLPLKQGRVALDHYAPRYVEAEPITTMGMRPMVRELAFDVCEMAFTTYLCARGVGVPITAIPVFFTRNFHHWAAFYNVNSGITTPKNLEGRVVGVNRGYTVTTGTWLCGILHREYGVDLDKVTWSVTDVEHVAQYQAPANVNYALMGRSLGELLASGEVAAAIGDIQVDSPHVKPLIPNAREAGFASYRKTGIYPLNHSVVIRNSVLAANPGLAAVLFDAFKAAKAEYMARLQIGGALTAEDRDALALRDGIGDDPFPYGVAPNRKAIETLVQFSLEQHIIPRKFSVEELFAPETHALL